MQVVTLLANGAYVDYQGTGFAEQSFWLSSNAGVLVDVTNPNGTLNNGFTIIGSSTTNQNGNAQGQAGITSISLNTTAVNTTDTNGDKTLATSAVTYGNGTTGTLSDMNMSVNTSNTIDESAGTINSAYATLPDVMTLNLNQNAVYQARGLLKAA